MKIRLAGLRLLIGGHLNINILPGVGLSIVLLIYVLLALTLTYRNSMVSKSWELRFVVCHKKSNGYFFWMKSPLIGFVEKQHDIKSPAWSGKD
jgi:hypothetical protein